MSMSPQAVQALLRMSQQGLGSTPVGQGVGDAQLGMGALSGFQSGTPMGYARGALDSARLANNFGAFGDSGASVGAGLGDAGLGLGVVGGLQQGGVYGDTQAAINAAQLGTQIGAETGAIGAETAGALSGALAGIGGLAATAYAATQPTITLDPSYYERMNSALAAGPGTDPQQGYNYAAAAMEANASGDPLEYQLLAAHGIHQSDPVTKDMQPWQIDQALGISPEQAGPINRPQPMRHAQGGPVKNHLAAILGALPMHQQETQHYDDGGYVEYTPESLGFYGNGPTDTPDLQQFVLPNDSQQNLQNALYNNEPAGTSENTNPITGYGGPAYLQNPGGAYMGSTSGGSPKVNIPGLAGSGLSSLLSNPGLLGALLGGGLGLAGALGSNNGQQTMLANYRPSPPPMFQGSGPSASNMYGNFSAAPRQRLNPTNIDYAHAGEQPTPGGNLFYSPSGGAPTAAPSQQSPLQQYGAQPLPQQPQPQQPSTQQLLQQLMMNGNQGMIAYNPVMHPIPYQQFQAEGGPIHGQGSPQVGPLSRHMTPATKGGPSYIQGPGDGTSDDIDARLSNGEYVMDAGSVAMLGNGSNEAGAKKLDELRMNLRKHAAQDLSQGKQFMKAKKPMSYVGGKS